MEAWKVKKKKGIILEVVSKTKFHTENWVKMLTHDLKFEFSYGD